MGKTMKKLVLQALLTLYLSNSWADNAIFALDSDPHSIWPKRYRSTIHKQPNFIPKMIGSGQFNWNQLKNVLNTHQGYHLYIIDLRQESHGFLNNQTPFSWYAIKNWENLHKSVQRINSTEKKRFQKLNGIENIPIYLIQKKSNDGVVIEKTETKVSIVNALSEQQFLTEKGIENKRFYVADRMPDSPETIDKWINLLKSIDIRKTILYIHCRGGSGRTTQFMAIADIWFNAQNDSLNTILQREFVIGGKDLTQLPEKSHFSFYYAKKRLRLVSQVYAYVKKYHEGMESFSSWQRKTQNEKGVN